MYIYTCIYSFPSPLRLSTPSFPLSLLLAHLPLSLPLPPLSPLPLSSSSPPSYLSQVQYYGLIKQATGEDWKDAKISLSTAQPSIGGSAPPLPTRIIRFKRPPPRIMPHMALSRGFGGGGYRGAEFYEYDPTIEDCYEDAELEAWSSNGAHFRSSPMRMRKGRLRRSSISPPPSPPALNIEVAQVIEGYWDTFSIHDINSTHYWWLF